MQGLTEQHCRKRSQGRDIQVVVYRKFAHLEREKFQYGDDAGDNKDLPEGKMPAPRGKEHWKLRKYQAGN